MSNTYRHFADVEIERLLPLIAASRYGDVTKVAHELGRNRHSVYRKLKELRQRGLSFGQRRRLSDLARDAQLPTDWIGKRCT
jgi:predicted transcriptional regulator